MLTELQTFTIIKGSDRVLSLRVVDKVSGQPLDLTGTTQLEANFLLDAGGYLTKTISDGGLAITGLTAGRFIVNLSAQDTSKLMTMTMGDFEVLIKGTQGTSIVRFYRSLTVVPRLSEEC